MSREFITLAIAIIGAVTGISGLLINLSNYLKNRAKLNIKFTNDFSTCFIRNTDKVRINSSETDVFCTIGLDIVNKSNKPVTITQIYIKDKSLNYPLKHSPNFKIPHSLLSLSTGKGTSLFYNVGSPIQLPSRLEPFDYLQGAARFPFFSKLVPNAITSTKITVVVCTSRRTHRLKVQLTELSELHRDYFPCNSSFKPPE